MARPGFVSLIGAGPGDPGLLTLRGAEALRAADVVVYDYLANPALLAYARDDVDKVYVGKMAGSHTFTQDEINALLAERALAGQRVARLKGGDPFVFGRGGEEALYIAEAGVPFEVIPGVTSAIAAAAYTGIPITHRGLASSFAVVTGHEDPSKEGSSIDWDGLATGVDTLVFLMAVGNLPDITRQLIARGRAPETPAATVRWGTMPHQETVSGTLADIAAKVQAAGLRPPAVTIIGQVAALREALHWFEDRPLFGQRVLVTRTRAQASALAEQLRALGAEAIELPTIRIAPPEDWAPLDRAIERLPDYRWIVFTSVNGVHSFWQRLTAARLDARALHGIGLAAIGSATASALAERGLHADYVPAEYRAEALAEGLDDVEGQRVLLPRADIARPTLADLLRDRGATVDEVTAYRTLQAEIGAEELARTLPEVTVATFTSSSTVRNLAEMARQVEPDLPNALQNATVACIGPITAQTAREMGLTVHVVTEKYTIDGLVEALIQHFARKETR